MIERFRQYIEEHHLNPEKGTILLAVSGGIDSMVMTHLFLRCGYDFSIGHCNFGLRGEESDQDELFVSQYSEKHNIEFHSIKFKTKEYASQKGISVQMAARELRFDWFDKLVISHDYLRVALAHNLNDNCETFIINLVRGTGISGMTGIKPVNGNLIRPLLFASRSDIDEYRDKYDIEYREDYSNSDVKYVRNRIRHNILPELQIINPSFLTTISETITRINEVNEIFSSQIDTIRESVLRYCRGGCRVSINELMCLNPLNTILFELFHDFGISRATVPELVKLTGSKNGSILSTKSHRFLKDREMLIITPTLPEKPDIVIVDSPGELKKKLPGTTIRISEYSENFVIPKERGTTVIDLDRLQFPLTIRPWREGDFFFPLGMNSKKKLSDFFIDNKFSLFEKGEARVLESGGQIASILGVRTDNRFKITDSTSNCLIIKFTDHAHIPR